jgi:glycerophosphoryl diester phosphodiesterase
MPTAPPDTGWLTERPIAHRGLHDGLSVPENTIAAAEAAAEADYAIEVDVRLSADDAVIVFHDATLERLAGRSKHISDLSLHELRGTRIGGVHPIPTLEELLAAVGRRVPVFVEIKSPRTFEAMAALVARVIGTIRRYHVPAAVMSFDPDIVALARRGAPDLPRGIVSCRYRPEPGEHRPGVMQRTVLANLMHVPRTRPHFIAYRADDLPQAGVALVRRSQRLPLLGWTIRTSAEHGRAAGLVDQVIFEDYRPRSP